VRAVLERMRDPTPFATQKCEWSINGDVVHNVNFPMRAGNLNSDVCDITSRRRSVHQAWLRVQHAVALSSRPLIDRGQAAGRHVERVAVVLQ
jgi:hypothetical protein